MINENLEMVLQCQEFISAQVATCLTVLVTNIQLPLQSGIAGCIPDFHDFSHSFPKLWPKAIPEQTAKKLQ